MKILSILLLLVLSSKLQGQSKSEKDSVPIINDYSNFNNRPVKKIRFKVFENISNDSALIILDGKFFKPTDVVLKNYPKSIPMLVSVIVDSTSTSGIKYIYIYKSKE